MCQTHMRRHKRKSECTKFPSIPLNLKLFEKRLRKSDFISVAFVSRESPYYSMASQSQPQQINVADLDLPQLAEIRKQLDEVCLNIRTFLLLFLFV